MKLFCEENCTGYGAIGVKAPICDIHGADLHVGDVVLLKDKLSQWSKLRFVACDTRINKYYVMGAYFEPERYEIELEISHKVLPVGFRIGNVCYSYG